jgi:predicted NBD/HSP70 family sugar kinase
MSQVISGQIFNGSSGSAGEIGHVCIDRNGPHCYCGKRGCVEAYASISGIARRVMEANKADNGITERSFERDLSIVQRLAAAAAAGDLQAKAYFDTAGEILGLSIGNLISLVNPSLVIIGGAFKQYAPLYMDRLRAIAKEVCWPYSNVDIVLSSLPPNAAAVGAAALFIQRKIWETLF